MDKIQVEVNWRDLGNTSYWEFEVPLIQYGNLKFHKHDSRYIDFSDVSPSFWSQRAHTKEMPVDHEIEREVYKHIPLFIHPYIEIKINRR